MSVPDRFQRLQVAVMTDRLGAPTILYDAFTRGEVEHDEFCLLLPDVWTGTDHPVGEVSYAGWVEMFRAAGFLSVARHPGPAPAQPVAPITIYRGATVASGGIGLSWSLHFAVAKDFSNRWGQLSGPSVVYEATVSPGAILAIFEVRPYEPEVVVEPGMLGHISVVE
jgi:hypothetical protein